MSALSLFLRAVDMEGKTTDEKGLRPRHCLGGHGPFASSPPCPLAEESVLMQPDGSPVTLEDSEDMNWLEPLPGPRSHPGTDLPGLDLDGHKIQRSADVSAGRAAGAG